MERHIATVSSDSYDIFITDKRFVMINLGKTRKGGNIGFVVGGIAGGLIGSGIDKLSNKDKREDFTNLTVDEILARDDKSYELPHGQITKIKLNFSRWDRSLLISYPFKNIKMVKKFALSQEQLSQLKNILPTIGALTGKLEVKE